MYCGNNISFNEKPYKNSIVNTLGECKQLCADDNNTCKIYNYHQTFSDTGYKHPKCSLFGYGVLTEKTMVDSSVRNNVYDISCDDQSLSQKCDVVKSGITKLGDIHYDVSSIKDCKIKCLNNTDCNSFNWSYDGANYGCQLNSDNTVKDEESPSRYGHNRYFDLSCITPSTLLNTKQNKCNRTITGADNSLINQKNMDKINNTLYKCKRQCKLDENCKAYDLVNSEDGEKYCNLYNNLDESSSTSDNSNYNHIECIIPSDISNMKSEIKELTIELANMKKRRNELFIDIAKLDALLETDNGTNDGTNDDTL